MVSVFFPDKDLSNVVIRGPGAVHPLNSDSFIIDFGHVFVTISVRLSLAYSIISVLPRTGVLKAIKKTPGMMYSRQIAIWQNLLILVGGFLTYFTPMFHLFFP